MRAMLLVALATAGCVDRGPGPQRKQIDPAYVAENLLTAAPEDLTNKVAADLGGKVVYLGNKVDRGSIAPGEKLEIRHYWKVVAEPGAEWRVFSHAKGDGNTADFMNVDETDMRLGHGPAAWKAGQIIQDIQTFTLKPDWKSKSLTVIVGLYPKGKHGVADRMKVVSGAQLENAVVAVKLPVDLSKAPPPAGTVIVKAATSPIVVDGVGDEPAWAAATASPEFTTAEGSKDPPGRTTAKLAWDDQHLYVLVQVNDPDAYSQYKQDDEPLWKNDVVELFIDADGNKRGYIELQTNPNNARFDTWWSGTRGGPQELAWSSNMATGVRVRGTADNRGDTDQGWDAELAIPWAALKGNDAAMRLRIPPAPGDRITMNVVRVDYAKDSKSPTVHSWNRITYQDFHALDKLMTIVLADAQGKTTATAEGTGDDPGAGTGTGAAGAGAGTAAKPGAGAGTAATPGTGAGTAAKPGTGAGTAAKPGTSAPAMEPAGPATPRGTVRPKGAGAGTGSAAGTGAPASPVRPRGTPPPRDPNQPARPEPRPRFPPGSGSGTATTP